MIILCVSIFFLCAKYCIDVALCLNSVASDVANFDGSSSMLYRLSARSSPMAISLNLKTPKNSGILLHAEGTGDHGITLALEKGKLLLFHQRGTFLSSTNKISSFAFHSNLNTKFTCILLRQYALHAISHIIYVKKKIIIKVKH